MPSVSHMKVVQDQPGKYLAFEGNGRLAAMQAVFSSADNMSLEVEEFLFRGTKKNCAPLEPGSTNERVVGLRTAVELSPRCKRWR